MEQNYLAQIQALIDQKWKENPEEMKRVMAEIKAKEKVEKKKAKVKTPKVVSFDPQLTQELIEELNKSWDVLDVSKVQDLIKRGADVKAENKWGQTPLHLATWNNNIEFTKFLIDAGVDLEAKDVNGRTPLNYTSEFDRIETAKLLLDAGAEKNVMDKWKRTPLDLANNEMRDLLKQYMK